MIAAMIGPEGKSLQASVYDCAAEWRAADRKQSGRKPAMRILSDLVLKSSNSNFSVSGHTTVRVLIVTLGKSETYKETIKEKSTILPYSIHKRIHVRPLRN